MTYHFETLGDERFQQLAQALIVASFPNAQCLPIGQPDGGRDGFVYRHKARSKPDLIIFQVKYVRDPKSKSQRDAILEVVKLEKEKVAKLQADGATAYYLITNVAGTSHFRTGSIDKTNELLSESLGIPAYCWWRDDLEARVSNHADIKWSFSDILKGSDILQFLLENDTRGTAENRRQALRSYIATQHTADQEVKFKQVELQNRLLDLFVDLPIGMSNTKSRSMSYHKISHFRHRDQAILNIAAFDEEASEYHRGNGHSEVAYLLLHRSDFRRIVLEGAPGQGKSTITQFLCQVNRIKILNRVSELEQILKVYRDAPLKVPFRIDLRDYATWIAGKNPFNSEVQHPLIADKSLEVFISAQVSNLSGGHSFDVNDLLQISKEGHIIIVLDGFDEVADIPTRRRIVKEITEGAARIQSHDRSAQVVVTSRPAAFTNSPGFEQEDWTHFEIQSMSASQIDSYSKKWMTARRLSIREKTEFSKLLKEKLDQPHMRDLARNPMQLTILLALIHTRGLSLPDKRTSLYDNYMELFFNRESEKSRVVREYRDLLVDIHRFLAWNLHVSAEGGIGNGSISDAQLRKLLKRYLEDEGHDSTLVDELFTGMVERVVALVSRVEGTFEFEVQPLREYFAARHLYETAPYSPPGSERSGTKPERFDALARNFYWLNVLRFFCGCFSRGELSSLVDGLQTISQSEGYKYIDHPRTLAIMLLGDWVFTQQPLSVKRVVSDIIEQPGFKRFITGTSAASASTIQLPERCGQSEIVDGCYSIINQIHNTDHRRAVLGLIRANTDLNCRIDRWRAEEPPIRMSAELWLADGRVLGIIRNLPVNECVELIHKYGNLAIQELIRVKRYEVFGVDEDISARAVGILWSSLNDAILYRSQDQIEDPFEIFDIITSPHFYRFVWSLDGRIPFAHGMRAHAHYNGFVSFSLNSNKHNKITKKIVRLISNFESLSNKDLKFWSSTLKPWEDLVGVLLAEFGPTWAGTKLAILSSGIRSTSVKGQWREDGWGHSSHSCSSMRYARLRAGNLSWWRDQIRIEAEKDNISTVCIMFLLWASPKVLIGLHQEISKLIDKLDFNDWARVTNVINTTMYALSISRSEMNIDDSQVVGQISARFAVALSMRFESNMQKEITSTLFACYEGRDPSVLAYLCQKGFALATDNSDLWGNLLRIAKLSYDAGVVATFGEPGNEVLPLDIAIEICSDALSYPSSITRIAQRIVASHVGSTAPRLGELAEREMWFCDPSQK